MAGTLRSSTDTVLRIEALAGMPGLVHGFSTSALGSMRPEPGSSSPLTPARAGFAGCLGLPGDRLTVTRAVHGTRVARVDEPLGVVEGCDGLVTSRPGLPLLATFADCYPLLLFDPERPALALVHAGWRGTAAGVGREAVGALAREFGSRPGELVAGLGPGICGSCYEVSEEVADRFPAGSVTPTGGGRYLLDLALALRRQLEAAGVPADRIHQLRVCTRETPELPSHRRAPDGTRFACLAALS